MVSIWMVVVVLLVLLAVPSLWRFYRKCRAVRAMPGWPTHWFWGNLHQWNMDQATLMRMLAYIREGRHRLVRLWFGPINPAILITHCSLAQETVKIPKETFTYKFITPLLGNGLVTAEGKEWLHYRRMLAPAFHNNTLKGYIPVTNSCLEDLLDNWTTAANDGVQVCTFHDLTKLMLDVLLRCAFSSDVSCPRTIDDEPYTRAVNAQSYKRLNSLLYMSDFIYYSSTEGKQFKQICDALYVHTDSIVRERKRVLGVDRTRKDGERIFEPSTDFLDIILATKDDSGKGMTDKEVRDEVNTFIFAGHHTTTTGMSWALYCLAQHPEHQDKVREEVRSVLMGRERLEYGDLKDLKYTTWCIKEALRLYPPIHRLGRSTREDVDIDGHEIPKGTMVLVEIFQIHRHPDTWEAPNEYNPLRFHPSNAEGRHPYAFIPFSSGHRNCIGKQFALNTEKIIVASIINRFQVSLDETHEVEMYPHITLDTKNDIKLKLKLID